MLFGPSVQIYTATHLHSAAEQPAGLELAQPVTIGSDVWVGGGAIICPGVAIGDRSVIGAGSVVTWPIRKTCSPPAIPVGLPSSHMCIHGLTGTCGCLAPYLPEGIALFYGDAIIAPSFLEC